jgi:hypothetical protein
LIVSEFEKRRLVPPMCMNSNKLMLIIKNFKFTGGKGILHLEQFAVDYSEPLKVMNFKLVKHSPQINLFLKSVENH